MGEQVGRAWRGEVPHWPHALVANKPSTLHPKPVTRNIEQVVNVGHLYRVAANDRADGVAKRMVCSEG